MTLNFAAISTLVAFPRQCDISSGSSGSEQRKCPGLLLQLSYSNIGSATGKNQKREQGHDTAGVNHASITKDRVGTMFAKQTSDNLDRDPREVRRKQEE